MSLVFQHGRSMLLWFAVTFLLLFLFRKKRHLEKQNLYTLFLIAYLVAVCSQTLFPSIDFGINSATHMPYLDIRFRSRSMAGLNLIPFKTILAQAAGNIPELAEGERLPMGLLNLVGNLCMLLPVGFLLPMALERCRCFGFTLAFAAALSCVMEILQHFVGRTTDIDDFLLQTLGAALGYGIWLLISRRISPQAVQTIP